ncbi:MAG: putative repeat protein (TIGR03806 family) [Flavobacteriales bacterium]|jgi:uncharacterized repeat protein (TIGR03806 family)
MQNCMKEFETQVINSNSKWSFRRGVLFLLLSCAAMTLWSVGAKAQVPSTSDFQRVAVAETLDLPMEFEIANDGRVFIVSKCGKFYGWNIDEEPNTAVRSYVPNVRCGFEDGLLSIALDPNFTQNNHVFLQYMVIGELTRVARFTVNADYTLDLNSYQLVLEWFSREASGHAGGSMLFDNDGNLIITTGDNNGATGYFSSAGQRTSGNTNDLNGKVLRITPSANGGYTVPAGNLFAADALHRPEIYAMGFRNAFRINKDSQTGYLYLGDVGPDASADSGEGPGGLDEINVITQAGNFGWPWIIGFNQPYAGFDPNNLSNNFNENTGATAIPNAIPAIWTIRHQATMAGPVYRFDPSIENDFKLPEYYNGKLIFWDFNSSIFSTIDVDSNEAAFAAEMPFNMSGFQGAIDAEFDPRTHQLYVLQWGSGCCDLAPSDSGALYRFDYIGGREAGTNIALGAVASASSELGGNLAASAIDGDAGTRWEGDFTDPQSIEIDFQQAYALDTIVITWEAAYSSEYLIEGSTDGVVWDVLIDEKNGSGGVELHTISSTTEYQYVRITGTARGTAYGHSIYEIEVFAADDVVDPLPLTEFAYLNMPRTLDQNFTDVPLLLSETGVFSDTAAMTVIDSIIPFEPNAKLWSDNAAKHRWLSLPADTAIDWDARENWVYPEGTVAVKQFDLPTDERDLSLTTRLETRLIVVKADGNVYGVTYKWRADNSDADLLTDGLNEDHTITLSDGATRTQTWSYPSTAQCVDCHNSSSAKILGLSTRQLNGDFIYPGVGLQNQLAHWNGLNIFEPSFSNNDIAGFDHTVDISDTNATLEHRVKSYLDTNCSHCHGTGKGGSQWDASFNTPLNEMGILNEETTGIRNYVDYYGIENARVVDTSNPEQSILFIRDKSVDPDDRMPPVGRSLEHVEYIDVLDQWIRSIDDAPNPDEIVLLSLDSSVASSTNESAEVLARAVDGDIDTAWTSDFAESQWISVDLGRAQQLVRVVLDWEAHYSSGYTIQGSLDNVNWTSLVTQSDGSGCVDVHNFTNALYRYVRVVREPSANDWGYSLWEFSVYGVDGSVVDPNPVPLISVDTPAENQQFLNTESVSVSVSVSETDWFVNGGSYRYTLDAGAPISVSNDVALNLGQLSLGNHSLVLALLDGAGSVVGDAVTRTFNVRLEGPVTDPGSPALIPITQPVVASSDAAGNIAANAVDDDLGSRWESEHSEPHFIQLDLGESTYITRVVLVWEAAYGSGYSIDVSEDATSWTTIYSTTTGDGGTDDIALNGQQGRYIRMNGTVRATAYGFSLFDFDVYGLAADSNLVRISAVSPAIGDTFLDTQAISLQVSLTDSSWLASGGSYNYYLDNNPAVRVYSLDAINIGTLAAGLHTIRLSLANSDGEDVGLTENVTFSVNCGNDCPNVLVFSKTSGFRHDSIPAGIAMVERFEAAFGYSITATEDSTAFTTENLAQYSTVVFMNTTGDILTVDQKAAFRAYIENGGGFVGTHSAGDTEHSWTWYTDTLMAGAEFIHHGDGIPMARIDVEDRNDPIMNHIVGEWSIADEWYFWESSPRGVGNVDVLANLDRSSYASNYPVEDHPIMFKNTVGSGRAFYTAIGHVSANFSNENVVEMVRKAIEWTSGN